MLDVDFDICWGEQMLQAAEFVQFVGAQAGEDPEDHPVALYEHLVLSSVRRCVLHNKAVEGGGGTHSNCSVLLGLPSPPSSPLRASFDSHAAIVGVQLMRHCNAHLDEGTALAALNVAARR